MIDTAFEEKMARYSPVPFVVVNNNGKVVRANELINKVFIYDESGQGTDEGADASGEELSAYTHVELHPVDSSLISGIGYDSGQNILAVEIRESQELLYYYDVPEEVYNEFNAVDPIDDYFYKNIKDKYISVEQR